MNTTPEADKIIDRVLQGDTEAYAELVRLYQKDVYRVVVYLLRNPESSRDLTEQVFVEAYLSLHRYQPGSNFQVWIKGVARNVVRAELRKQSRESRRLQIYRHHVLARLEDETAAEKHDQRLNEALRQCREQLPEDLNHALQLRYQQDHSFEEIAQAIGRSVDGTRQLLFRVRALLRECVDKRMVRT